jgi:biopolymer transport protein ExbD
MSGSAHSADRAEPNLTPILDMVFQLITFFMLVINFKAAETDTSLKLPVVGSARPVDSKGVGELLVLNLNKDGKLMVRGKEEPSIEGFIRSEKEFRLRTVKSYTKGDELPITVVIRADRTVLVRFLMRVVTACQAEGCRKFDFMVMRQASGGAPGGGN